MHIPSPKAPAIIAIEQEHRQAGVGRQLGRGPHPARPVVHAVGRQDRRRRSGGQRAGRRLGARLRSRDRQEAVGVRHQPEGLGLAEDAQRGDRARRSSTRTRSTSPTARTPSTAKASATSTHRRHQARRHHADGPRLALRQDPPLDLHGVDRRRPALHPRLQRLPALPRREDRPGLLDARHVRRGVGLAAGRRRQGLSRRRGRRRRRPAGRQGEEGARAR